MYCNFSAMRLTNKIHKLAYGCSYSIKYNYSMTAACMGTCHCHWNVTKFIAKYITIA